MGNKTNNRWGYLFIPVCFILSSNLFAEHPDSALKKISERYAYFTFASKSFNIDIKTLLTVVFVERTLNYDWKDGALDIPLARSGYNSSIGFCQLKLKTAYFIEKALSDSTNSFYAGIKYCDLLNVSKNPNEIIHKLLNDSLNIHYAAAYLRIILSYWERACHNISNRPDILGTLYSTGLFLPSGEVRKPNDSPKANFFGKLVFKYLKTVP